MRIDPIGQIAIGVGQINDISAKLHINNTTSNNTILIEDTSNPDPSPFLIDNSGMVSIGTTAPKTTSGGIKPKFNVSAGDSGVGATGLPIYTSVLIENDTTAYWGFLSPDTAVSGIYMGTPSDAFGMSLTWDFTDNEVILGARRTNASIGFNVGNKTVSSIVIEPKVGTTAGQPEGETTIYGDMYLATPTVPGSSVSTGTTGQISWDSDYIYVCVGTNTWKRTQIATW